jgi:hypothetical protein
VHSNVSKRIKECISNLIKLNVRKGRGRKLVLFVLTNCAEVLDWRDEGERGVGKLRFDVELSFYGLGNHSDVGQIQLE